MVENEIINIQIEVQAPTCKNISFNDGITEFQVNPDENGKPQ